MNLFDFADKTPLVVGEAPCQGRFGGELADELPEWRIKRPIPTRAALTPLQEYQCRVLGGMLLDVLQPWVRGLRVDQEAVPTPETDLVRRFHPTIADLSQRAMLLISDVPGLVAAREILGDNLLETGDWEFETKGGLVRRVDHPNWPRIYPILSEEVRCSWEILGDDCQTYWEFNNRFESGEKALFLHLDGSEEDKKKKEAKWADQLTARREKLPGIALPDTYEEALPNLCLHITGVITAPLAGSTKYHLWFWDGEDLHLLEENYICMIH